MSIASVLFLLADQYQERLLRRVESELSAPGLAPSSRVYWEGLQREDEQRLGAWRALWPLAAP